MGQNFPVKKGELVTYQISLDLFSRLKVSVKFGTRSNAFFVTRSKVLLINSFIFSVDQIIFKVGGLDVETNRDRDRERPTCRDELF